MRNRIVALIAVSGGLGLLLLARLFQLQVVEGDFWAQQALLARYKADPLPFHRGTIFDRTGKVLAEDVDTFGIAFSYRSFRRNHPIGQSAHLLALVEGRPVGLLEVASDPEGAARRIAGISSLSLWNLPGSASREDARFYLARLLGLSSAESVRWKDLLSGENLNGGSLLEGSGRNAASLAARLERSYIDLVRLEGRAGLPRGSLIVWIDERRRWIEQEVARRAAGEGRAGEREKKDLRQDLEQREIRWTRETGYELAYFLSLHRELYPGFAVHQGTERTYPAGIGTAVLGLVQRPSEEDLKRSRREERELLQLARIFDRTDAEQNRFEELLLRVPRSLYHREDQKGRLGLEAVFESRLRGEWGSRLFPEDRGEKAASLAEEVPPLDGENLYLSLCAELQGKAEQALREGVGASRDVDGAAVVLDLRSGEILALATNPAFSVAEYREGFSTLAKDPRHPLHHRAFNPYVPPAPGSVFKLVAAYAALELGKIAPETTFECAGEYKNLRCNQAPPGHGAMDLRGAIQESCNVYFYHLGEILGAQTLADYAARFGFGRKTGLELREVPGDLRPQGNDPRRFAIGQALVEVTPLQIARFYAALGNGGRLVAPRLVHAIGTYEPLRPAAQDLGLDPRILAVLNEGMARAVAPGGTAHPREGWDLRSVGAVGKTGTAEVGKGIPDHAWFAGFLPADAPAVAICVFVERGGRHGGDLAAPLAYKILSSEAMERYLAEAR